jgi:lecithin-cholesterol acyltransferase
MFSVLLTQAFSKPPVVLLPGLYGSALTATYEKGFAKHWYCPGTMDNELFWVDYKYAVPPVYNCLFEMLRGYYDETTGKVTSPPGLTIDVPDYGGEEGLSYVDEKGVFGLHFIESFHAMLKYLKDKGYTIKKDLFGSPYDWRLAMSGLAETFFPKLKALIEEAYTKNENQKVTVLGYSCGGMCIQQFFTKYVSKEWKAKYIKKAIFLAPAFAGSMDTFDVSWNRYFPILPFLKSDTITETVETVPCIHTLYPNVNVFGDKALVIGPNGEKYTAKDIPDFLVAQGKFSEANVKLMRENIKVTKEVPQDPEVPLMMLFNSGVQTRMTVNFKNGYEKDPETIYEGGDGTVPAIGPKWACENWKHSTLQCVDVAQTDDKFNHGGMSTNAAVHDIIYQYITDDNWVQQKKSEYIQLPKIEMYDNATQYRFVGKKSVRSLDQ